MNDMPTITITIEEYMHLRACENKCNAEDCISREYLRKSMIEYGWSHPDSTVTEYVESLPSAYPKSDKPSGKWITKASQYDMLNPQYICSECGNVHTRITPYCEMCGAKMVDPQESEDT